MGRCIIFMGWSGRRESEEWLRYGVQGADMMGV
jgi:hypothetical protein